MNQISQEKEYNRLQQIILFDSFGIPNSAIKIIKSDIMKFLQNHFAINKEDFVFDIALNEEGKYIVKINFVASDIYQEKIIK
ncbi:MAG: hypothetical protein WCR54_06690 [Clostridia bacterium]